MKYRHIFNIVSASLLFTGANIQAQRPNAVPENKYGLKVISNQAAYAATVALDSNQRMVAVKDYFSPVLTNWYYARPGNFTGQVLYKNPQVLVRLPVAKALANVQASLRQHGFSLLFYDAYRPYAVTEKMWTIVPDERYAANPAKGSGHNRGISVDVTLADLATGREVAMPTGFDDFSEKAHHDYMQLDSAVIANRLLLRTVMQAHGFTALSTEWWHYSYTGNAGTGTATRFDILNLPFEAFLRRADQALK